MRRWIALIIFSFLLAGCAGEWGNRLPYAGPVEIGIEQGEFLPGTKIQYLHRTEEGAQVSIDGQETSKKVGDSLDWRAEMVPGVDVDQTLRIDIITQEKLHTAGTVRVIVAGPNPQPESPNTSASVHFKLPVGYHVEKGKTIPGTTITYLGKTDQGAHLGNLEGSAYRKLGDSITWEGKLREGIWIALNLRTELILDNQLDVIGTADLWITPVGD